MTRTRARFSRLGQNGSGATRAGNEGGSAGASASRLPDAKGGACCPQRANILGRRSVALRTGQCVPPAVQDRAGQDFPFGRRFADMRKNFDPRVDAYIAKSAEFARPILQHLRELVHGACPEAEEEMKWNMPFFMHH